MANIILQLCQHGNTSTHWHFMKHTFLPSDGITTCIRSTRSMKCLHKLFIQCRTLACDINHKITIGMNFIFQLRRISLFNGILLRHISIILLFHITKCSIFLSISTICNGNHLIFEILHICIKSIRSLLYLHRFVIPRLCFLCILTKSSFKLSICFTITFFSSTDSSMQTIIHSYIAIQNCCTDVERQHGGQHQIHHTNHFLSRGFRTVRSSTHTIL